MLKTIMLGFLGFMALAFIMAGLDALTNGISTGIIGLIVLVGTGAGFLWCIGITIQGMFNQ